MSAAPIVGISTYSVDADWTAWRGESALTPRTYIDAVVAAGGLPVLLPSQLRDAGAVARMVDMVDAVMLIGGEDMCARWSGRSETPDDHAKHNYERDLFDVALADAAWELDKPLLGICRGAQVLNISRGGTLVQDLPTAGASGVHLVTRGVFNPHPVSYGEEFRDRQWYAIDADVPSHHHQAIDALGDGLVVAGRADDGVIEAVEGVDRRFVVGVQWHPEEGTDSRLFDALVAAGRNSR